MLSSRSLKSKIIRIETMPTHEELLTHAGGNTNHFLVIYDQILGEQVFFRNWIKQFNHKLAVEAGEGLKTVESLPENLESIVKATANIPHQQLCIVAIGGGSVGDFAGFVASIYKRGIKLMHIPTTWLAALDSAHGGKTALNLGSVKNQIGTFYSAQNVFVVKEVLQELGRKQSRSAVGELVKMAVISGRAMLKKILNSQDPAHEIILQNMSAAIKVKMKIVGNDPFETKNERQKLNLGHTLGHALESQFRLPHGFAVAQGIYFSINWSLETGLLNKKDHALIKRALDKFFTNQRLPDGENIGNFLASDLLQIISQDKKLVEQSRINFVFVRAPGKVEVIKVAAENLVNEAKRQGWAV